MTSGDPISTAKNLTTALDGVNRELKRLRRYGHHNRWLILVDVVLTVALSLFGALSIHSAVIASRASSAQLALCRSVNAARSQQVSLWEYVLHLSPAKTPQEHKVQAIFSQHLHQVFAPRDCEKLDGGP